MDKRYRLQLDLRLQRSGFADKFCMFRIYTIMYPHKEDSLETVKEYIDFSQNEILWKEMGKMSGLGMSILEEGIEQGIEALILDNLEDGKSEEVIIGKLVKRFGLNIEAAKEYFEKYSKEIV